MGYFGVRFLGLMLLACIFGASMEQAWSKHGASMEQVWSKCGRGGCGGRWFWLEVTFVDENRAVVEKIIAWGEVGILL